ncbi:pathogenesis-related protein 1-like [Melia azedarach]|uniref:Pathogenesis-related protein 1-like n=1 Tax=Melia azedarach TaxID=155640 RepID=A0ACC1XSJ8_MELAZ|nr:pathogenesis-related protein 1-like [Melia azedarach]
MAFCKISLALILCLALAVGLAHAEDSKKKFLDAHNSARAEEGVEPLVWDQKVASYARDYAEQRKGDCQLQHSDGPYGENIAWSSTENLLEKDAVKMWVDEKADYDYETGSCVQGKMCGHYTQIVWRDSRKVGCAKVQCSNKGGTFVTCNYEPAGNIQGEKPY